ncbi:hypothetical protein PN465_06220 [Nodularia spumigena CS-584]|nr:hypothetical protein [Nodularia spumigena]EAW46419.1 hypothetical protein N9414_06839 [Nodularia spumigena CCY9414]MDB9381819.1 hypothetical protein [Nodularia spumigena CS-584]MEA5526009.1 hypothetical protein [Nodularia spumigena UHCC 0143]MEA5557904.1 hypothetical protein [Nodularia spumigena CH309]MEA5608258.1 hypothetical protein [Nodularia spumigena UHCC 0060]
MHNIPYNLNIKSPPKPDYSNIYTSPNYQIKTYGECNQGTYVKIYIPENPYYKNESIPQAVIYLHGFALGASEIYSTHFPPQILIFRLLCVV